MKKIALILVAIALVCTTACSKKTAKAAKETIKVAMVTDSGDITYGR